MINQSQKLSPEAQEELFQQIIQRHAPQGKAWTNEANDIIKKYKSKTTIKGLSEMLKVIGYTYTYEAIESKCRNLRRNGELSTTTP